MSFLDEVARIARGQARENTHPQDGGAVGNFVDDNAIPRTVVGEKIRQTTLLLSGAAAGLKVRELRCPGKILWVDPSSTGMAYVSFGRPPTNGLGAAAEVAPFLEGAYPLTAGTVYRLPMDYLYVSYTLQDISIAVPTLVLNWGDFDVTPSPLEGLVPQNTYGARISFTTLRAANTAIAIISPLNNQYGIGLISGFWSSIGPANNLIGLVASSIVAVPAFPVNGEVIALSPYATNAVLVVPNPIKIPRGRTVYEISSNLETSHSSGYLYTLF